MDARTVTWDGRPLRRRLAPLRDSELRLGDSDEPAVAGLLEFEREFGLDRSVVDAFLAGVEQDLAVSRYGDEADLLRYCFRVAGTVGLMMCAVLGVDESDALPFAIDLGIGMQLTNIARDILEDAGMNRRYVPGDWVGHASPAEIRAAARAPDSELARDVTASAGRLLDLAETFYSSGARGYRYLPWRAHLAIGVAARVYRQIGIQLRDADLAWHAGRQVTGKAAKLRCSLLALGSFRRRIGMGTSVHDDRLHAALRGLPYVA